MYRLVHCGCCAPAAAASGPLATPWTDFPIFGVPILCEPLAASGGALIPHAPGSALRFLRGACPGPRSGGGRRQALARYGLRRFSASLFLRRPAVHTHPVEWAAFRTNSSARRALRPAATFCVAVSGGVRRKTGSGFGLPENRTRNPETASLAYAASLDFPTSCRCTSRWGKGMLQPAASSSVFSCSSSSLRTCQ